MMTRMEAIGNGTMPIPASIRTGEGRAWIESRAAEELPRLCNAACVHTPERYADYHEIVAAREILARIRREEAAPTGPSA